MPRDAATRTRDKIQVDQHRRYPINYHRRIKKLVGGIASIDLDCCFKVGPDYGA